MCWSFSASVAMVVAGSAATVVALRRRSRPAIPVAFGYFTIMEALQAAGYGVVGQCGDPLNQSVTLLSYLHIAFQPLVINAFAMELVPAEVRRRVAPAVYIIACLSATVMLMQLYPFAWAGQCRPGDVLCGSPLCLVAGNWHIAWNIPYNDLLGMAQPAGLRLTFPTYMIAVFLVPALYGAWRFVLIHALAGPILANMLTDNPNEWPAVWCLFSIGIILIGLSPWLQARVSARYWPLWPRSWLAGA
ncbi:DUF5765 domain-containing protein [Prosthecomicrobium sp. N25]|uniref:DUF5765 domain-containing protein n=1 Tax=Prosthecomicrobium sp. N25 TaxID=3129254 RepID=UPI0030770AE3